MMRADLYLFSHGYAQSRNRAQMMISDGVVKSDGKIISKSSEEISENSKIEITDNKQTFVGRGFLKLEGAFDKFSLCARDMVCVDIGASTGGFTQCLLSHGARFVYAVDAGRGQLAECLLKDARVKSMENFNARELSPNDFTEKINFAVMDVSFISQTLIIPKLSQIVSDECVFVSLIKPQFEAGRENVGRGGIVKSETARKSAIKKVVDCAHENDFMLAGLMKSPIEGGDGNIEYISVFFRGGVLSPCSDIGAAIDGCLKK